MTIPTVLAALLLALHGATATCFSPGQWANMIPAPNVTGLTTSASSNGQLVAPPVVELPDSICAQLNSFTPTAAGVYAVRVFGHEWGNVVEQELGIGDNEWESTCWDASHFWPLLKMLGALPSMAPTAEGRRDFSAAIAQLSRLALAAGPSLCWVPWREWIASGGGAT